MDPIPNKEHLLLKRKLETERNAAESKRKVEKFREKVSLLKKKAKTERRNYESPGEKKDQKEIDPLSIHELRVKNMQIQHETKVLKTQLNRIKDAIHYKTKAINKTVSTSDTNTKSRGESSIISQLQDSIISAQETLNEMEKELERANLDDRCNVVEEIQEDLKVTYSEYMRLKDDIAMAQNETDKVSSMFNENASFCSDESVRKYQSMIRQLGDNNQILKSKADSYLNKHIRMTTDKIIRTCENDNLLPEYIIEELNGRTFLMTEKANAYIDEFNRLKEHSNQQDCFLRNQINEMRQKIYEHMISLKTVDKDNTN